MAKDKVSYLYVIREKDTLYHKVGYSEDPQRRLKALQVGNPHKLELLVVYKVKYIRQVESILHDKFREFWVSGEWFLMESSEVLSKIGVFICQFKI